MSTADGTVDRDALELVARHGSSPVTRGLALAELAKRDGREDELRELVGDATQ